MKRPVFWQARAATTDEITLMEEWNKKSPWQQKATVCGPCNGEIKESKKNTLIRQVGSREPESQAVEERARLEMSWAIEEGEEEDEEISALMDSSGWVEETTGEWIEQATGSSVYSPSFILTLVTLFESAQVIFHFNMVNWWMLRSSLQKVMQVVDDCEVVDSALNEY